MKNVKLFFSISALVLFASACNERTAVEPDLDFVSVSIPDHLKTDTSNGRVSSEDMEIQEVEVEITTDEGKKVKGIVRVTMPTGDEETLINFEVTNNILDETGADSDFWLNALDSSNARVMGIGGCLKNCRGDKREGWCRAGCWAELALKVVAVVVLL